MAESGTITREMIEVSIVPRVPTVSLKDVCLRRHRASRIEQSANLTHRMQNNVWSGHVARMLGGEAVQRLSDLVIDCIHQSETVRSLTTHVSSCKRQVRRAGKEKRHTIRLLRCGRGGFTTACIVVWTFIDHQRALLKFVQRTYAPIFGAYADENITQYSIYFAANTIQGCILAARMHPAVAIWPMLSRKLFFRMGGARG